MDDTSSERATADQKARLKQLGISFPADISRDRASERIKQAGTRRDAGPASTPTQTPTSTTTPTPTRGKKKGGGFKGFLRFLFFAAAVGVLASIFWPTPPTGDGSELDEARIRSARAKLIALRDRPQSSQTFTEEEINAYLYDLVTHRNQAGGTGTRLRPDLINVNVLANELDLTVRSSFKLLPISYKLRIQPSADGGVLHASILAAKLGHLPMPPPLTDMVSNKMEAMFSGMPAEISLWRDLELFKAEAGVVTVRRTL